MQPHARELARAAVENRRSPPGSRSRSRCSASCRPRPSARRRARRSRRSASCSAGASGRCTSRSCVRREEIFRLSKPIDDADRLALRVAEHRARRRPGARPRPPPGSPCRTAPAAARRCRRRTIIASGPSSARSRSMPAVTFAVDLPPLHVARQVAGDRHAAVGGDHDVRVAQSRRAAEWRDRRRADRRPACARPSPPAPWRSR